MHAFPERCHRIEDGARRSRQRAAVEGDRISERPPAPDEPGAIGFPFDGAAGPAFEADDVEGPDRRLLGRPPATAEQQACALRLEFGLDEQLAEGWMRDVVHRPAEDDL